MISSLTAPVVGGAILGLISIIWVSRDGIPEPLGKRLLESVNSTINRVVLLLVVGMILMLNMIVANEVLSHQTADSLTLLITVGPLEVGAYDGIMLVMTMWAAAPLYAATILFFVRYRNDGDRILTEDYWSDSV